MDRTRLLPPDPMEATQVPVEGVDVPATETAVHGEKDHGSAHTDQSQFAENEGLTKKKERDAAGDVEGSDRQALEQAAQAAQRGRTA